MQCCCKRAKLQMEVAQLRLHEWTCSYSSFSTLDIDVLPLFQFMCKKDIQNWKTAIAAVHCLQKTQKTVCERNKTSNLHNISRDNFESDNVYDKSLTCNRAQELGEMMRHDFFSNVHASLNWWYNVRCSGDIQEPTTLQQLSTNFSGHGSTSLPEGRMWGSRRVSNDLE